MKKKICIVSGSRAEYGLLYWLMKEIAEDKDLELQIIATGMHLSPEFGLTYKIMEIDGFQIDAKVEMLLSSDTPVGITKSIGLGVIGFADAFSRLKPDMLVILGDRFEILGAAQAAVVAGIPIAHIHGGEITEGAIDEVTRHAITKFSQVHFVASEVYRSRVVQMGEQPDMVFNYGAPGLDYLDKINFLDSDELRKEMDFNFTFPLFSVTYHPETLDFENVSSSMTEILAALEEFPDACIIFTYPNADTGGRVLIEHINQFVSKNFQKRRAYVSLGQQKYLSLLKLSDAIIGNSSSGLTEAPALKIPTVNIGERQKGRLKSESVIDCKSNRFSIADGIRKSLSPEFKEIVVQSKSLYDFGNASERIKNEIKNRSFTTRKSFFDIEHNF